MTNGERYELLHPDYEWDIYDDDEDGDYIMTRSDHGKGSDGDFFFAEWWFREESQDKWTVAMDELIISHEFTIDELTTLFKDKLYSDICQRKNMLEHYGLKGVRML